MFVAQSRFSHPKFFRIRRSLRLTQLDRTFLQSLTAVTCQHPLPDQDHTKVIRDHRQSDVTSRRIEVGLRVFGFAGGNL